MKTKLILYTGKVPLSVLDKKPLARVAGSHYVEVSAFSTIALEFGFSVPAEYDGIYGLIKRDTRLQDVTVQHESSTGAFVLAPSRPIQMDPFLAGLLELRSQLKVRESVTLLVPLLDVSHLLPICEQAEGVFILWDIGVLPTQDHIDSISSLVESQIINPESWMGVALAGRTGNDTASVQNRKILKSIIAGTVSTVPVVV